VDFNQSMFNDIFRNEAEGLLCEPNRSMIDDADGCFTFRWNHLLSIKPTLGYEFQKQLVPGMYSSGLGSAYGVEYKISWGKKNRDVIELFILIKNSSVLDAQKLLNILYEKKFWHGGHLGYDQIRFAEQRKEKWTTYQHEISYSSVNLLQHIKNENSFVDAGMKPQGQLIGDLARKSLDYIEIFHDEILHILKNTPMGCTHILDLKYKGTHPTEFVNQRLENCEGDSQNCGRCHRPFCSNHFNKKSEDESNICYQCEGKGVWCNNCFWPLPTKENEYVKYCRTCSKRRAEELREYDKMWDL